MKKRILAVLLAICMVLPAVPSYAAAGGGRATSPSVLLWSTGTGNDANAHNQYNPLSLGGVNVVTKLESIYQGLGCTVDKQVSANEKHFPVGTNLAKSYDLVYVVFPSFAFTKADKTALKVFMQAGGRVVFQCEDPAWAPVSNTNVSNLLDGFKVKMQIKNNMAPDTGTGNVILNSKSELTKNVGMISPYAIPVIEYSQPAEVVVSTAARSPFIVDQAVFKGRATVITDMNFYTINNTADSNLFENLLTNSQGNMGIVEGGGDPNGGFGEEKLVTYKYQAAAGTTRSLPAAISNPSAAGAYQAVDSNTYAVGTSVTRKGPPSNTTYQEMVDGKTAGIWKLSWNANSGTMAESGLTFTGTWTFDENYYVEIVLAGLEGLAAEHMPTGYPLVVNHLTLGSSYVAKAPEVPGYTVDKTEQTVSNIRSSKTIVFTYTKACDITVRLEGLDDLEAPPEVGWTRDGQAFTKGFTAVKGGSFTAAAPTVAGYLVDRYAVTLDPVTENKTIVFRYAKEGVGNKGRNVKVKLRDTDGKTLSVEGYATQYVVEKGAGISLAAPEIPGYTFLEGTFSPKPEGYALEEGVFTADRVTQDTTVTFTYEKQPEPELHTVTVTLSGLDTDDCPEDYPLEIQIPEGGSYTAIAPQIEGYTVDKTLETLKNIAADRTITFTYTKESVMQYEVNVELLEKKSETVTEKIEPPKGFITKYYITQGGGFSLTPPTLDGYNYIGASDNTSVAPIKANQTVQFFYKKPVTHTVTIILKGASLAGYPKTVTVPEGSNYTAIAPMIDGKKVDKYSDTVTVNGDTEIVFTYKKLKGPSTPKPPEEEPPESPVGGVLNADDHIRYMVGHASGLFGPEGDLTRAQCAQIFYNLLLDKDAVQRVSFPDVPEDKWYARAIETLAGMDVLRGYSDGTFQPEKSITRAEFTAIAMRFGELDRSGENPFPDVTEGRWYYSDVVGSAKYGWIQGYTDGTFRPEEKISRTEVTYIVNRMLKRTADQGYIDANPEALASFPDLPSSYWGYYSIMEATNAHDHTWKDQAEVWTKIR